jgi:hypothetical protein
MSKKDYGNPMIRVPKALTPTIRELARLYRQGDTERVVEGLQQLLAALTEGDSTTVDTNLYTSNGLSADILARLESLEQAVFSSQMNTPASTTVDIKPHTGDSSSNSYLNTGASTPVDTNMYTGNSSEMTTPKVAEIMGCSPSALTLALRQGRIPYSWNGWVAEPTGKRYGKAIFWRVWRE